jgi:hypothetical protein
MRTEIGVEVASAAQCAAVFIDAAHRADDNRQGSERDIRRGMPEPGERGRRAGLRRAIAADGWLGSEPAKDQAGGSGGPTRRAGEAPED